MPRIANAALVLCVLLLARPAAAADGVMERLDFKPFWLEVDVGDSPAAKKAYAQRFAKHIVETGNYFLKVYDLKKTCFEDYAAFYDPDGKNFERAIRVRIFRTYDGFLADFQKRYESKSLPGAFFGTNRPKDEYGKLSGPWLRELSTHSEGITDEQVLRHLYHEMGHLFMQTFITYQVEVPSWIEEGTAELFQFRPGNGTNPEAERDERSGWLVEMIAEGSSIPWPEFIDVRNLDNLDFTWKDQLRSTVQYAQAWSVLEFMVSNPQRQQAFIGLLRRFKEAARTASEAAAARGLTGEAFAAAVRPSLYAVQETLFKESYGAELVTIEDKWKQAVAKAYEKDVVKKPVLRYHRGEWHLAFRARAAKDPASREAELGKAEVLFAECVQLTPDLPEGHVGLGRVALERGDAAAARDHFATAMRLGTGNFDALLYGGMAAIHDGRAADAVPGLERAVAQRPTHFEANFFLGQALAVALAAGAAPPAPADAPAAKPGKPGKPGKAAPAAAPATPAERALLHLVRARDLRKQQTSACALIEGMVHYQAGDLAQAGISFLRAGNAEPTNPLVPLLLAVVRAGGNQRAEAAEILAAAEKSGNPFAAQLAATLADAAQPVPRLIFSTRGWPLVEGHIVARE